MDDHTVGLKGDPDDIAAQLLKPQLPSKMLDAISIRTDTGIAELLMHLVQRMGRASIEKDEMLRFVERNRSVLDSSKLQILGDFAQAAAATDRKFGEYFKYFDENLKLAVVGRAAQMDMRSDKLFWLIFVLAHQVDSGYIAYDAALRKLSRPDVKARISEHQLVYMVHDYAQGLGTVHEPPREMLLLIGECGLLGQFPRVVQIVAMLLAKHPVERRRTECIGFLTRSTEYLRANGKEADEIRDAVSNMRSQDRVVPDDDF